MGFDPGDLVDICVCTYRRPGVEETLESIAALRGVEGRIRRVLLVDNAETPEAAEVADRAAHRLTPPLVYRHAPAHNISVARNACLDLAEAQWVAFLDDDERATPNWLAELLADAEAGDWQAVLGPVDAVYPPETPDWIRRGDFHSIRPLRDRGVIKTGYTSNVLIRRAFVEAARLRFDPALGRSGGEDSDFFCRFREAGGRIGFADKALVLETAGPERLGLGWLLRRRFRYGQTHGELLRRHAAGRPAFGALALASIKAGVFACAAASMVASEWRRNAMLARAALHCGVVSRLAGFAMLRLY